MKRSEIWEANIGGRIGKRPVLVLTRSNVIPYLNKVVVAEITSQGKGYPTQIQIGQSGNLKKESFVSTDNLHTLPKERLQKRLGELSSEIMDKISKAIIFALDLGS
jgi:mRNA interferase MazF